MFYRFIYVCFTLLGGHSAFCQVIENIRSSVDGDKIVIEYDLPKIPANAWIDIKAYGSHNSFSSPLTNVTGANGKITSIGASNKLVWNYGNVLDNFNGDLSFEIEAEVIFKLTFVKPKKSVRRGKDNTFSWTGGRPEEYVRLKLIAPGSDVVWEKDVPNKVGMLKVNPRPKLALSKEYQIELSTKDDTTIVPIQMKRKVSRFWIVSPIVLAAGAGAYFLFFGEEPLPTAPGPPNGN
jgi:hypothetical protein